MELPHPLPEDLAELIARRFRVLGEPMRIRLLDHLREGEAAVGELSDDREPVAVREAVEQGRSAPQRGVGVSRCHCHRPMIA